MQKEHEVLSTLQHANKRMKHSHLVAYLASFVERLSTTDTAHTTTMLIMRNQLQCNEDKTEGEWSVSRRAHEGGGVGDTHLRVRPERVAGLPRTNAAVSSACWHQYLSGNIRASIKRCGKARRVDNGVPAKHSHYKNLDGDDDQPIQDATQRLRVLPFIRAAYPAYR